uniref:Uncharacterized protein n=1 Tax=Strongyloides papillosus TaxID=174720 RepID=A0A0N5BVT8_STREA
MTENLFDTLSFNYWHSYLRQRAVEDEEKNEIKRQLKRITTLLNSERELASRLNGINDVDIERLIHYLKFDKIDDSEEIKETKEIKMAVKLNEIPIHEILDILNIHEKINKDRDILPKYLWKFNRKLQINEHSNNLQTMNFNENYRITESSNNFNSNYKFIHNKISESKEIQENSDNNDKVKTRGKSEPDNKTEMKNFTFNRKFT